MSKNIEIPIVYTYPNISSFQQRGGLKQRINKLNEINKKNNNSDFKIVEIPADFIKNKTEEKKAGLEICSMLDNDSVKKIYSNENLEKKIKYTLQYRTSS